MNIDNNMKPICANLKKFAKWFIGKGAKYQSCLPVGMSVGQVFNDIKTATNFLELRMGPKQFKVLTFAAEDTFKYMKENKKSLVKDMTPQQADIFLQNFDEVKNAVGQANKILRALEKRGKKDDGK